MDTELEDVQLQQRPTVSMAPVDSLDPATFDWNAYCGTYKGRALVTRLAFIPTAILSSHRPSRRSLEFARAAALRALPVIKKDTLDHALYLHLIKQINETLNPDTKREDAAAADEPMDIDAVHSKKGSESDGRLDAVWVEEARQELDAENNRLAVELNGYLSNLIKESIRLTYIAQAQLSLRAGNLAEALKSFQQVREHCSGSAHQVELGLGIVESALQFNVTDPLPGNVNKVEASLDRLHPVVTSTAQPVSSTMTQLQVQQTRDNAARSKKARRQVEIKLRVAKALLSLQREAFANTARELGQVGEEGGLQEWEGEVISSADVAFLTAICALASGDRADVRSKLLDRPSFHASVDDSQSWILDLVRAFVDARYGEALKILRKAEPFMLLNPFLSSHTPALITAIRTRALVQYLAPFSTVRLSAMATAFDTDEETMLVEVCDLAEKGAIKARIDLVDRIVTLPSKDPRADAFRAAIENGAKITAQTQANMLRMRLKEAEIMVGKAEEDDKSRNRPAKVQLGFGNRFGSSSALSHQSKGKAL